MLRTRATAPGVPDAQIRIAAGGAFADTHVMDLRLARSTPEALAATVAQELSATLPYVAPAGSGHPSLVRVLNDSAQANTVQVTGYDDTGRRFGPEPLSVAAHGAATLTTTDLEQGGRGFAGLGDGEGWWRLELAGQRPFRAGMYYRTADGFLAELTRPVAGRQEGTDWVYEVDFFNPGSNTAKVSILRLANPNASPVSVSVTGLDDAGEPGEDTLRGSLPAQAGVILHRSES